MGHLAEVCVCNCRNNSPTIKVVRIMIIAPMVFVCAKANSQSFSQNSASSSSTANEFSLSKQHSRNSIRPFPKSGKITRVKFRKLLKKGSPFIPGEFQRDCAQTVESAKNNQGLANQATKKFRKLFLHDQSCNRDRAPYRKT